MAADRTADIPKVQALLLEHFGSGAGGIYPLAGGFSSRAYACISGGRSFVVRLNAVAGADDSFANDEYAFRHFATPALPIPRIVARGRTHDEAYAISERLPGRTLTDHSVDERQVLLPAVLDMLDVIATTDTSESRGYGNWNAYGNGSFERWHDYLASADENQTDGYYADWHAMFHESFLERDVFETVYRCMLQLMRFCPDERALVHNDFQFENILAEGERITGVIDWANALYGDPLYDVARLIAWSAHPGWWYDDGADLLRARFGDALHYDERIACYLCHLGLDDLRFYARTGNLADYDFFRERLLALVAGVH